MLAKNFSVEVRNSTVPGTAIISVAGSLVLEHLVAFQEVWESHPEPFLILDVSGLSYLDSAAVGFLVNAYISRERNGKRLALSGVHGMTEHILSATRVAKVFETFATIADAEESFRDQKAASA